MIKKIQVILWVLQDVILKNKKIKTQFKMLFKVFEYKRIGDNQWFQEHSWQACEYDDKDQKNLPSLTWLCKIGV